MLAVENVRYSCGSIYLTKDIPTDLSDNGITSHLYHL